jgi:hypothetical protein
MVRASDSARIEPRARTSFPHVGRQKSAPMEYGVRYRCCHRGQALRERAVPFRPNDPRARGEKHVQPEDASNRSGAKSNCLSISRRTAQSNLQPPLTLSHPSFRQVIDIARLRHSIHGVVFRSVLTGALSVGVFNRNAWSSASFQRRLSG